MFGHRIPPAFAYGKDDGVYQHPVPSLYPPGPDLYKQHVMMHGVPYQPMMNAHMIPPQHGSIRPPQMSGDPASKDILLSHRVQGVPMPSWNVPEGGVEQHTWNIPALNQYASGRLAIYVENASYSYELVESDLRELFSYYSGVHCLAISPDYPAAELIVTDPNSGNVAAADLNGLVLHGIGTLRCVVMNPGQTLQSVLSSKVYDAYNTNANALQNPYAVPNAGFNTSNKLAMGNPGGQNMNSMSDKINNDKFLDKTRPLLFNNVEHVAGITNHPDTKRVCRFELIELFSYEPDFDVTSSILGVNNANIEYIMKNSNNKVDLSIKGKPLNSAPVADRLHLSITSTDFVAYNKAIFMVEDMLSAVCEKYVAYVKNRGKIVSNLVGFRRHEYEEDANGNLDYKGSVDKPKTWLDVPRRSTVPNKTSFNPNRNFNKRVNDRSRSINNTRNVSNNNRNNIRSKIR